MATTTANANPVAGAGTTSDILTLHAAELGAAARAPAESCQPDGSRNMWTHANLLRQHYRTVKLQLWCAALVPFNILRHVRVLPSDAISCHFQTNGLAAESPRLSYAGFFLFWMVGLLVLLLLLQAVLSVLTKAEVSDDRGHELSMLAVLYFSTPTMVTYMLVNLAVIEANAEDSFVLTPSQGGPAMCPADTCTLCAVFVPLYYGCLAGQRFGPTSLTWMAAVGLLVNLHPSPSAFGAPLFSLPQLVARLGAPLGVKDARSREEHGLKLAVMLLWLLWIGPMVIVNSTGPVRVQRLACANS